MALRCVGKIGVYGPKTRCLQRKLSYEAFGLTFKIANVYLYLGSRANVTPDINDIQSKAFFEVPDRAYATTPIQIPIGMDAIPETKTDFSRFGIINPLQDETLFRVHIDDFAPLGREMVVGDVFEVAFHNKNGTALWEVSDVDFRSEIERFVVIIHASPLNSARTTREIPTNRDNDDLMDSILDQIEDAASVEVPAKGIFEEVPAVQEVDYRDETQAGFLDDINKEF